MKIYGCISVKPVGWEFLVSQCSTANWWERSPNYNNANNFCNVNTNGNANNNNSRNSNGLAPDFVSQKWSGSIAVTQRVNYDLYERRNTSRDENPKLPFDVPTRTPPELSVRAWREKHLTSFHVSRTKQIRRCPTRHLYGG